MINRGLNDDPRFRDFFDFVFIDEKWFYLCQKSEKYYLLPEEDDPNRTCKNKNYIPMLMLLCVTARPRFRGGECIFDRKIECFPLVTYEPAQRSNAVTGRVRGDMVMKPIQNITRDVIRDFVINHVLPAIKAKWPREDVGNPIYIQQDNAPTHLKLDDPLFCDLILRTGGRIQPTTSAQSEMEERQTQDDDSLEQTAIMLEIRSSPPIRCMHALKCNNSFSQDKTPFRLVKGVIF
jgi:hypothetical protein